MKAIAAAETREKNIERILRDTVRLREGLAIAGAVLADDSCRYPVSVVMIDLDGSAVVRREGIEAKVELVGMARERMISVLPAGAAVADSGTRDETYVLLPGYGHQDGEEVSERLRTAICELPFAISSLAEQVPITASVGYTVATERTTMRELITMAREAQFAAKQRRNCVRAASKSSATERFMVPSAAAAGLKRAGLDWDDVGTVGLDLLEEKMGGLWHWCVEQAGPDGRPTTWSAISTQGVDSAEAEWFRRLHDSVRLEALVAGTRATAGRYRFEVHDVPPQDDILAAEYRPSEWVWAVADDDADAAPPTAVIDQISRARWAAAGLSGGEGVVVEVDWSPSRSHRLNKLQTKHALSATALFTEATILVTDRATVVG
ncbi:GGDEF domain-containing protein [Kribbella sp. NPDC056345]|uniref:GGDEF domain-containing protein n=1 Tax=Kribbella sp. NPDC056345 TaxID=3345789 RepID=UPI0035DC3888